MTLSLASPTAGVDVGDHPPITPVRCASEAELGGGDTWRLYDFVARHFLGSLSPDCVVRKTRASLAAGTESFAASGTLVLRPGYAAIMPWKVGRRAWGGAELAAAGSARGLGQGCSVFAQLGYTLSCGVRGRGIQLPTMRRGMPFCSPSPQCPRLQAVQNEPLPPMKAGDTIPMSGGLQASCQQSRAARRGGSAGTCTPAPRPPLPPLSPPPPLHRG